MKKTYCNPLAIPEIGYGRWLDCDLGSRNPDDFNDYRSISDPSVIYYEGKWILYPSYSVAYVTEDFVNWKHVDIGIPHARYSPAVVQFRGKWYLSGHGMTELFSADNPLGPFTVCGHFRGVKGNIIAPIDACFLADGDHLYMYWCAGRPPEPGMDAEHITRTVGVELDPDNPWQLLHEPVEINCFDPNVEWQRTGEYHQNCRMDWIEGQWMKKIGNRYYRLYSGAGTEYSSYVNGVCISEEGPLSGFHPQKKHDPLTQKRYGVTRGAGHGCLVDGPNGTLWVFYTCIFCLIIGANAVSVWILLGLMKMGNCTARLSQILPSMPPVFWLIQNAATALTGSL